MHLNLLISGNLTGQIGEELSVDLWENFVSGMSNYPDYDADSISFFKPHEGNKFAVGYFNFLLNTIFVSRYRLLPCPWALPALQWPVWLVDSEMRSLGGVPPGPPRQRLCRGRSLLLQEQDGCSQVPGLQLGCSRFLHGTIFR